jgi:short-subunit dehydrogenase
MMAFPSPSSNNRNADAKVFLVTGATGAMGKAIARQLAATPDSEVVLVCRHQDKAEQAVKEIVESTGNSRVRYEIADLSRQDQFRDTGRAACRTRSRVIATTPCR